MIDIAVICTLIILFGFVLNSLKHCILMSIKMFMNMVAGIARV